MTKLKHAFVYLFFVTQFFLIVNGQFTKSKYFNWVPYDEISLYEISVLVNEKNLNAAEIENRYRKPKFGRENRDFHNLISIVNQYESSYGKNEEAYVRIVFLTNGYRKTIWSWPENAPIEK